MHFKTLDMFCLQHRLLYRFQALFCSTTIRLVELLLVVSSHSLFLMEFLLLHLLPPEELLIHLSLQQ